MSTSRAALTRLMRRQSDMVIVFERANALFIFNFHPTNSYTDYRVGTEWAGEYRVVLSSDDAQYGGHDRVDHGVRHFTIASSPSRPSRSART